MVPRMILSVRALFILFLVVMAQRRSPQPLNFLEPKWDAWKSTLMTFRLVTELNKKSGEI